VLVAGGHHSSYSHPIESYYDLSSAELFDPATNTFSSAGIERMSVPRSGAVAAALSDGRVLVAGGADFDLFKSHSEDLSSAEAFNPATNTFSSAGIGSLSAPRVGAAAAPLPGGRVLVAGGGSASAEIFAPVSCRGRQATIVGSPSRDGVKGTAGLVGTRGPDVIMSLGGNDMVSGGGGDDLICGGDGNDNLNGGAGNDRLYGQGGNDKLHGNRGRDRLYGQAGNDALNGGPGRDKLTGSPGRDHEAR
jgi:Ca2+-binding RTX toxin-like protein